MRTQLIHQRQVEKKISQSIGRSGKVGRVMRKGGYHQRPTGTGSRRGKKMQNTLCNKYLISKQGRHKVQQHLHIQHVNRVKDRTNRQQHNRTTQNSAFTRQNQVASAAQHFVHSVCGDTFPICVTVQGCDLSGPPSVFTH